MKKLNYREVTKDNIWDITKLSNTLKPGQEKCVAPNVYSIAQGSVHSNAYYRGIYLEDIAVGFFMLSIPSEKTEKSGEDSEFYLWRFMIGGEHQNKHYGTEVLDYIVEYGKSLGFTTLSTSCQIGEISPYDFYIKYGFVDTGTVDHGEQVLLLTFE